MATARVLVVHDEPRSLRRIRRVLSRSGYEVGGALNREQALVLVRRSPPVDLVLADLATAGGSLITDIARRSPSAATLFIASRKPARPVPPPAEILWTPFSDRTLLRRVQQVLAKAARAQAVLDNDLERADLLRARMRVLLGDVAGAVADIQATRQASRLSRETAALGLSSSHCPDEALEEYSLKLLDESARRSLEKHLEVCELCQIRLGEAGAWVQALQRAARDLREVPLDITHQTAEGTVRLLVEPAGPGGWQTSLNGHREAGGATRFATVAEANNFILERFRLMFPDHQCDERCDFSASLAPYTPQQ